MTAAQRRADHKTRMLTRRKEQRGRTGFTGTVKPTKRTGHQEAARRVRQIAAGRLTAANGLAQS